jgi:hypothetical protein
MRVLADKLFYWSDESVGLPTCKYTSLFLLKLLYKALLTFEIETSSPTGSVDPLTPS